MHKNIVSDDLKEWAIALEAAVKEGYSVVEESVAFESGYFKVLTKKQELEGNQVVPLETPVAEQPKFKRQAYKKEK